MSCELGLIGLAVMGQNLALNIAENGFHIAVYNRTGSKTDECVARAKDEGDLPVEGYKTLEEFVAAIKVPRQVIILVKAGPAVDHILGQLTPLLSKGDVIIDGGNEWYELTEQRTQKMESLGFHYLGMGVSGGEEGARHGPALMPGGTKEAYALAQDVLEKVAAKAEGSPCVSYVGKGGSGHFVKMVHNGIEYGDMQLISEAYDILKRLEGMDNYQLNATFTEWNKTELESYLIEITADIFQKTDDLIPTAFLVDAILDVAGSKGTGLWTIQEAARRGVPCPTIEAAVTMRNISTLREHRVALAKLYPRQQVTPMSSLENLRADVKDALYCAKICSYAQGMMLLRCASRDNDWGLNLSEIARGWRGGCIIRARLLEHIRKAFDADPNLQSLLLDTGFASQIRKRLGAWRRVVAAAVSAQIPVTALAASLTYFDAITADKLPLNLVQAQRDYFGAHTYERIDHRGTFHTEWKPQ